MSSPNPLGKKGYCVFPSCQTIINTNSSTKEGICPTIGNKCRVGSLSGYCIPPLTCRYEKVVTIAKCGKKEVKSDNLQYNTVGRWYDGMIVPPPDGPMFILI